MNSYRLIQIMYNLAILCTIKFKLSSRPENSFLYLVFPFTSTFVCEGIYIFLFSGVLGSRYAPEVCFLVDMWRFVFQENSLSTAFVQN
jgi:hypothetical protein